MGRLTFLRVFGKAAVSTGLTPIPFDTRWGTATDSTTGLITFGLKSGCRRVYVNNSSTNTGNDANDGLTPATAKLTWNAAHAVYIGSGCQPGDQLMVAEGSNLTASRGSSMNPVASATPNPTYMSVVRSYDPADPTNATKFGRAVGAAVPVITLDQTLGTDLNVVNGVDIGWVALQALEIKSVSAQAFNALGIAWGTNKHPGMVLQLVRLNGVGLGNDPASGSYAAGTNVPSAGLISKCSQWNSPGLYLESSDSFRIEGFISAHNGWNINATRDCPLVFGGASTFAHSLYLRATNTNLQMHRLICVDATDGLGTRCGGIATQLISVDNPVAFSTAGKSGDVMTERPDGALYQLNDGVIMGMDRDICLGQPGGWAVEWNNNIIGSYARNVAAFDFDAYGYDSGYNRLAAGTRLNSSLPAQYMLLDKWSCYRVAITGESDYTGGDDANYHFSIANSVVDALPTGLGGSVTATTTRASPPAGYKTRAQTYAALGYANKAEWVNAMLYRPDLLDQMAQAICGISLPAMGLTPLYQTALPPAVVTGAPAIYPTALVDLTLASLSFTRGVPKAVRISGFAACSRLTCSDLPSGFSMTAFRAATTGTVTSGSNQITGVGSISGMVPGMYVEAKSNAFTATSLFPAGTVITAVSGTTITCSANATGSSSAMSILVSAGGATIHYDGTGSGAATPTIHLLETAKDTAMGTRTTALALSIT